MKGDGVVASIYSSYQDALRDSMLAQQQQAMMYQVQKNKYDMESMLRDMKSSKQETKKVSELRAYFTKNSGVIFTVALVILADHFVFGGAFREKLKSIVDSFLNKAGKQIEAE